MITYFTIARVLLVGYSPPFDDMISYFIIARVLLVDYSPPFDADTCEYLYDTLMNFFSLVTHLSGPCRTPFFGLFVLKENPEVS